MRKTSVIVRDVVRSVVNTSADSVTGSISGVGLRTKAGGYILAQTGMRIKVK